MAPGNGLADGTRPVPGASGERTGGRAGARPLAVVHGQRCPSGTETGAARRGPPRHYRFPRSRWAYPDMRRYSRSSEPVSLFVRPRPRAGRISPDVMRAALPQAACRRGPFAAGRVRSAGRPRPEAAPPAARPPGCRGPDRRGAAAGAGGGPPAPRRTRGGGRCRAWWRGGRARSAAGAASSGPPALLGRAAGDAPRGPARAPAARVRARARTIPWRPHGRRPIFPLCTDKWRTARVLRHPIGQNARRPRGGGCPIEDLRPFPESGIFHRRRRARRDVPRASPVRRTRGGALQAEAGASRRTAASGARAGLRWACSKASSRAASLVGRASARRRRPASVRAV